MKLSLQIILLTASLLCHCNPRDFHGNMTLWHHEIMAAEKAFADQVKETGLHSAFVAFAAEDAVLMRGNQLIKGKLGINAYYEGNHINTLSWKPEYVDVAASGDLSYTYGPFTFTSIDSLGNKTENKGIFHTVWKRQEDGSWKYVWD